MFSRLIVLLILAVLHCGEALAAGDGVPNWFRQAAAASVRSYEKDVPAVVLHDEQQVSLGSDGKLVTTENFAVKLLNREGRSFSIARAVYWVSAGKVREIEAWLIRPDGSIKVYDKKSVLDVIADQD